MTTDQSTMSEGDVSVTSRMRKSKKLGEILVEKGLITRDQLEQALEQQSRTDHLLGRVLIDLGVVKEPDLMAALAGQVGVRFVDLAATTIDPSAAMLIPQSVARRCRAIPLAHGDGKPIVTWRD